MMKRTLTLMIAMLSSGYAMASSPQVSLDYGSTSSADALLLEEEMQRVYESGLMKDGDEVGTLGPDEQRLLEMKIREIEKRIYEQDNLRPHISDLYFSNSEDALDRYIRERFGFTAEQWKEFRKTESEINKAKNEPISNVEIRIREETLDNGSVKPIELSVVPGYATAVVFVDVAGNPWPIQGDITGDGNAYSSKVSLDHVAVIDNIKQFSESNALVNLASMDIPVVLSLKSNKEVSDSRVIIHLPELGPNSQGQVSVRNNTASLSNALKELLNKGRLDGYREFSFKEIPGSVYFKDGWMYIRTKHELIVPSPQASAISPTGYQVHQIPAHNMFLFRDNKGNRIEASLGSERDIRIRHKTELFER